MRCIAITCQEWLLWIETGSLRCAQRVRNVNGMSDEQALIELLESAPDFPLYADEALVFAVLRTEAMPGSHPTPCPERRVGLQEVAEFFPLNSRGARLLERDADRARSRLGPPRYEVPFKRWREDEREKLLHRKGKYFVLAAGFEELVNEQIEHLRAHHPGLPTAVAKYERYRNYAYFAWAVALIQLSERLGGERWKKLKSALGKSVLPDATKRRNAAGTPVAHDSDVRALADRVREELAKSGDTPCFLCRDSVIVHWVDRLRAQSGSGLEREEELRSLGRDIRVVDADEGREAALTAAYTIGREAQCETVLQLYFASRPTEYPALAVPGRDGWAGPPLERFSTPSEVASEATTGDEGTSSPDTCGSSAAPPTDSAVVGECALTGQSTRDAPHESVLQAASTETQQSANEPVVAGKAGAIVGASETDSEASANATLAPTIRSEQLEVARSSLRHHSAEDQQAIETPAVDKDASPTAIARDPKSDDSATPAQ